MPDNTRSPVTLQSLSRALKPSPDTTYLKVLLDHAALARQRRHRGELPDHLLREVGLSPDNARLEARRKVWDAPAHWRRPACSDERDPLEERRHALDDFGARHPTLVRAALGRRRLGRGPRHG